MCLGDKFQNENCEISFLFIRNEKAYRVSIMAFNSPVSPCLNRCKQEVSESHCFCLFSRLLN